MNTDIEQIELTVRPAGSFDRYDMVVDKRQGEDLKIASVLLRKQRDQLSIRITDALEVLDDLERSTMVQGGFPKMCLRKIRSILKGERADSMELALQKIHNTMKGNYNE